MKINKMKKRFFYLLIILFLCSLANAQVVINGEYRPRTEMTHGYKALAELDQEPGFFTTQRSRLNIAYNSDLIKTYFCLQDIRTWGSQRQLVSNDGALTTFHEAWGMATLRPNWFLKMGRQEISLDDHRIFGNVGWAQQARSHDAAMLIHKNDSAKFQIQLALAYNQPAPQLTTNIYQVPASYKTFQYLWINKKWSNISLSILALNIGNDAVWSDGSHKTHFSQTIGGRLGYSKNKMSANLALYMQAGTLGDTLETKLDGQLASFDVSYSITKELSATIGYEYISGQSQTETGNYYTTQRAFNPYFGTNHKFNGFMDYFYVGNHANNVGLNDMWVRLKYKPAKWYAMLDVHSFSAAANVADPISGDAMNKSFGTEIDLSWGFNINSAVKADFVYAQMFGTETLVALKGGSVDAMSNYAYVMFTFKPTFFKN